MPETRLGYALTGGLLVVVVATAALIVLQILNWLLGDPRWWLVIALLGVAGFLVEWRHRGEP